MTSGLEQDAERRNRLVVSEIPMALMHLCFIHHKPNKVTNSISALLLLLLLLLLLDIMLLLMYWQTATEYPPLVDAAPVLGKERIDALLEYALPIDAFLIRLEFDPCEKYDGRGRGRQSESIHFVSWSKKCASQTIPNTYCK
jgi:hypothetical protein